MKSISRKTLFLHASRWASVVALAAASAQAGSLDAALTDLVGSLRAGSAVPFGTSVQGAGLHLGYGNSMVSDSQGRVLVDIYLNGTQSLVQVEGTLGALGAVITGTNPYFQHGAISAYVPISAIQNMAGLGGVKLMNMSAKPATNVGKVTSQGTKVLRSDVANTNGFTGSGITVGVLSDSYDTAANTFTTIHAADDIASGDLPTPKFVTDDVKADTDEGRAMMQIVYDVAPQSSLCFATAFIGEASFASNIRLLRTNPSCNADVIVDDVFYYDEPFFSDGQVAQAVNDVVTSTTLAGKKVAYFSSAGNQQGGAYSVNNAVFSAAPTGIGNINLATIGACNGFTSPATGNTAAAATSFLDFGGGNFAPALSLSLGPNSAANMVLQWDDLFYQGKVTTDLNFYLFDVNGNCAVAFAADNINTSDNGFEFISIGLGAAGGTFNGFMMIGRTNAGTNQAANVRILNLGGYGSALLGINSQPATFGHSAAAHAVSVAAYVYSRPFTANPYTPAFESFSSAGPVINAFDANGNRLPVVETRKKPDLAAPDGVDTTFFYPGQDADASGFPNFFGTSAAAPHAAGVAALMLQKAGGPGMLSAQAIKSYMQSTAPARGTPAAKGYSIFDGFGLIDAVNALSRVQAPLP